jgi:hypothetical protein
MTKKRLDFRDSFVGMLSFLLLLILSTKCHNNDPDEVVLNSFESNRDLDGVVWQCKRWFSLSDSFSTNGKFSLRIETHASDTPLLRVFPKISDWHAFNWIRFDVLNSHKETFFLFLRVIDQNSNSDPGKFFTKKLVVKKGLNHFDISLHEVENGPFKRKLKLKKISKIAFLFTENENRTTFFMDNIMISK